MSKQQLNWLVGVTTSTCIRVYVLNTFIAFRDRHDILHSTDIEKKKTTLLHLGCSKFIIDGQEYLISFFNNLF